MTFKTYCHIRRVHMHMSQSIYKRGIVKSVNGPRLTVVIDRYSACASCHAAATCATSERKPMAVEARVSPNCHVKVGDTVYVSASGKGPMASIMLGYGLPLAMLIVGCVAAKAITKSDIIAAVGGLCVTAAYFLILWTFKTRIDRAFGCMAIPYADPYPPSNGHCPHS